MTSWRATRVTRFTSLRARAHRVRAWAVGRRDAATSALRCPAAQSVHRASSTWPRTSSGPPGLASRAVHASRISSLRGVLQPGWLPRRKVSTVGTGLAATRTHYTLRRTDELIAFAPGATLVSIATETPDPAPTQKGL